MAEQVSPCSPFNVEASMKWCRSGNSFSDVEDLVEDQSDIRGKSLQKVEHKALCHYGKQLNQIVGKADVMTNDSKVKDCNVPPLSAGLLGSEFN